MEFVSPSSLTLSNGSRTRVPIEATEEEKATILDESIPDFGLSEPALIANTYLLLESSLCQTQQTGYAASCRTGLSTAILDWSVRLLINLCFSVFLKF